MAEHTTQARDVEALLPALAFHACALLANRRAQDAGARSSDMLAVLGCGPRPPSPVANSSRPPTATSRSGRCPTRRSPGFGPPA
jgi:hypothetical protein